MDKNLNPGLNAEHWKVLDRQSEPKDQRLILHINWDTLVAIKSIGYKIFTEVVLDTASSKSGSEEKGDDIPTPSDDRLGAVKSSSADQGTPLVETLRRGWKQTPFPRTRSSTQIQGRHTHPHIYRTQTH
jgi:hypothetical protein